MDFIYCLLYQMDSRFFSSNLYIHVYFGSLVSVELGRFHHCRILGNNHIHTVRSTFRKVFRLPKGICATMRACNYSYEHWDIHVLFLNKITEFGNKTKINFLRGWTDANICESIYHCRFLHKNDLINYICCIQIYKIVKLVECARIRF